MTIEAQTEKKTLDLSALGPRMRKAVVEATRRIEAEAKTFRELVGNMKDFSAHVVYSPFSPNVRGDVLERLESLKGDYGHALTPQNYGGFIAGVEDILREAAATRPTEDNRRTMEHEAEMAQHRAEAERLAKERRAESDANAAEIDALVPSWAGALIYAEQHLDESDSMTDYFGHATGRRVLLGWRKSERENFRTLREAAARFPETAHLGPGCAIYRIVDDSGRIVRDEVFSTEAEASAWLEENRAKCWGAGEPKVGFPESIEHRDNYSMGEGNWLGRRRHSGWMVKSRARKYAPSPLEIPDFVRELAKESAKPKATARCTEGAGGPVEVRMNEEKNGVEVVFSSRPSAAVLAALKSERFRWGRGYWYAKQSEATLALAEKIRTGAIA